MFTLRQFRRARLMSIHDLARTSGVGMRTIVEIEHGRATPRLRTIRILCAALGVDPSLIVEFSQAIGLPSGELEKVEGR